MTQVQSITGPHREINVKFEDHPCADGYIVEWEFQEDENEEYIRTILINDMSVNEGGELESFEYTTDDEGDKWCEYHGDSMPRANHAVIQVSAFAEVSMPDGTISRVLGDKSDEIIVAAGNQILRSEMWSVINYGFPIHEKDFDAIFAPETAWTMFRDCYYQKYKKAYEGEDPEAVVEMGHCDGMLSTGLASIMYNTPSPEGYGGLQKVTNNNWKTARSGSYPLSWIQTVRYALVLQNEREACINGNKTWRDLSGLYTAIKNCQEGNGLPVSVGFGDGTFGHAVLAIAITEESSTEVKIETYDPNRTDCGELYLYKDESTGAFTGWKVISDMGKVYEGSVFENPNVEKPAYIHYTIDFGKRTSEVLTQLCESETHNLDLDADPNAVTYIDYLLLTYKYTEQLNELSSLGAEFPETFIPIPVREAVYGEQNSGKQSGEYTSDAYWVTGNSINLSSIPEGVDLLLSSGWHSAELETSSESDISMTVDDSDNTVVNITPSSNDNIKVVLTDHLPSKGYVNSTNLNFAGLPNTTLSVKKKGEDLIISGASYIQMTRETGEMTENRSIKAPVIHKIDSDLAENESYIIIAGDTYTAINKWDSGNEEVGEEISRTEVQYPESVNPDNNSNEPAVNPGTSDNVSNEPAENSNNINNSSNKPNVTITQQGKKNRTSDKININSATVSGISTQTYTGKAITPVPTVKVGNSSLKVGTDYTTAYSNNINPGTAVMTITGKGNYTGTKSISFVIKRASQPMTVKAKTPLVKALKLEKKKQTIKKSKAFTIKKAQGKVTFKKKSGSKKLTISKTGKITVKKGTKKGTYRIKVAVTAAGNDKYEAGTKIVTVKVKVKK